MGEVTVAPAVRNMTGTGRESDKLRTTMKALEVGMKAMAEEYVVEAEEDGKKAEGGGRLGEGKLALEAIGFLTQDLEPSGTTLIDARNGFNNMSLLAII